MIVLKPCINLLNLSWIIKCLFLRYIGPLNGDYRTESNYSFCINNVLLSRYDLNKVERNIKQQTIIIINNVLPTKLNF